jgi:hypothetical protein
VPIYDVLDEGNEPDKLLQDEMFAVEGLEISGLMEVDMDSSPVLKYFETRDRSSTADAA